MNIQDIRDLSQSFFIHFPKFQDDLSFSVENFQYRFSIVFFLNSIKKYTLRKNFAIQICRSLCSKQFCIITFFSYLA